LLFSLFSILPRPPIPTLFPYTTLFRSEATGRDREYARCRGLCIGDGCVAGRTRRLYALCALHLRIPRRAGEGAKPAADGAARLRDRKSTRLNSSHLVISYAVFCLKKKN